MNRSMRYALIAIAAAIAIFLVYRALLPDSQPDQPIDHPDPDRAFLLENAEREGVQVTASGLQYEILNAGEGRRPTRESEVTVHYRGTLIDGTQFDASYDRGVPATFLLNRVIAGWTEGLQLIGEGGQIMLYIPSELAYGQEGRPPVIHPGATLVFEVSLIEVHGGAD
jgi:FKBP-type peptidyl-prolyl cis-trans isomerase